MSTSALFVALSIYDRPGGIQRFNQRLVRALSELPPADLERAAVLSLVDREPRDLGARLEFVACGGSRLRLLAEQIRRLRSVKFDVLILGHMNLLPLAALARLTAPRVRIALCVHGFEAWGDPRWRRARRHEGWLLRGPVDSVLSVSQHTAATLARRFGAQRVDFRILPNAIDVEPGWKPPEKSYEAAGTFPRLLSVTKLAATETAKGIAQVIEALALLTSDFPDLVYEVVGGGPLVDRYRRLADDLGVGDRVTFAGEVDEAELAAAYGRADVFVLPSKKEGFGIVFLEAWKYGLPVICGTEDASPEVVREGGLAVAPDDVDALAAAIRRLLGDGDLRRRLASRGFEQMRCQYLHPHFVTRLREILRDLSEAAA